MTPTDNRPDSGERGDVDLVHEVTRALEITLAEHGLAFDPVDDAERVGRALTANLIARIPRLRADRPSSTEAGEEGRRHHLVPHGHGAKCVCCGTTGPERDFRYWASRDCRPDPSTSGEACCLWPDTNRCCQNQGGAAPTEREHQCYFCGEPSDKSVCPTCKGAVERQQDAVPTEREWIEERMASLARGIECESVTDWSTKDERVRAEAARRLRSGRGEGKGRERFRVAVQHVIEEAMNEGERQGRGALRPVKSSHYTDRILAALEGENERLRGALEPFRRAAVLLDERAWQDSLLSEIVHADAFRAARQALDSGEG